METPITLENCNSTEHLSSVDYAVEMLASIPGYLDDIQRVIHECTTTTEEIEWLKKFNQDPSSVSLMDKVKHAPDSAYREAVQKILPMIAQLHGRCYGTLTEDLEKIAEKVRKSRDNAVTIDNYLAKPATLFSPDGYVVGVATNDTAVNHALAQIKERQLEGYYWIVEGESDKITISKDGVCDHYPEGFLDSFGNVTSRLV